MDHATHPRNGGAMKHPDAVGRARWQGRSPRIEIYLRLEEHRIAAASFTAFGCGVTMAAGSVLTQAVSGRSLNYAAKLSAEHIIAELGGLPNDKRFCADLAIDALRDALQNGFNFPVIGEEDHSQTETANSNEASCSSNDDHGPSGDE